MPPELARVTLVHARALSSVPEGARRRGRHRCAFELLSHRLLAEEVDSLSGLADELAWTLDLLPDVAPENSS